MRIAAIGLAALVVGLLLGGLGPRADLARTRAEVDRLKQEVADCRRGPNPLMAGMATMLSGPARSAGPRTVAPERTDGDGPAEIRLGEPDASDPDDQAEIARLMEGRDPNEMIDAAAQVWQVRAAQSRQALIDALDLNPAEVGQFDEAMLKMNERLMDEVGEFARSLDEGDEISPRDAVEAVSGISEVLVDTYAATDPIISEDRLARTDLTFEVLDFVDPSVARPLAEIALGGPGPGGP